MIFLWQLEWVVSRKVTMAGISTIYPKNARPFIHLKSRCSTVLPFWKTSTNFLFTAASKQEDGQRLSQKKSQHSVLKKCVTIWIVESDARSIFSGAIGRFALAFVLHDFLGLCMPRLCVAQCSTTLVCTKISKLSAHHICPDLVALLLSSEPGQNWYCIPFFGSDGKNFNYIFIFWLY